MSIFDRANPDSHLAEPALGAQVRWLINEGPVTTNTVSTSCAEPHLPCLGPMHPSRVAGLAFPNDRATSGQPAYRSGTSR